MFDQMKEIHHVNAKPETASIDFIPNNFQTTIRCWFQFRSHAASWKSNFCLQSQTLRCALRGKQCKIRSKRKIISLGCLSEVTNDTQAHIHRKRQSDGGLEQLTRSTFAGAISRSPCLSEFKWSWINWNDARKALCSGTRGNFISCRAVFFCFN